MLRSGRDNRRNQFNHVSVETRWETAVLAQQKISTRLATIRRTGEFQKSEIRRRKKTYQTTGKKNIFGLWPWA